MLSRQRRISLEVHDMRLRIRLPLIGTMFALVACSSGPRRPQPRKPNPPRTRVALPPERLPPRRPLPTPRIYVDRARLARLQKGDQHLKGKDPHVKLALGRLHHLAGRGASASRSWAAARRLLMNKGAAFRPEIVTPNGVSAFAWRGQTLAVVRQLYPADRNYLGGWRWLELWDRVGDRFVAPRLRVGPPGASGGVVWASDEALWWHGGHQMWLVDASSGVSHPRLTSGQNPKPRHLRYAKSLAVARTSGHLAATTGPQTVRVWDPKGKMIRDVVIRGTTSQMIRANMGTHCVMRSMKLSVAASRLALSARGRWLAIGANDGKVRLVNLQTGRLRKLSQKWRRMSYAFPRNPFDRSRVLKLWFSAGGKRLNLLQADSSLFRWDTRTGRQRHHWRPTCQPKVKPRGKPGRRSGLISPRLRRRWARQRCANVNDADLAASGKLLATVQGTVRLRRLPRGTRLPDLPPKRANGLRFDSTGKTLAVSRHYRGGSVWQVTPAKKLGSLVRPTVQGKIVDLSPDGRYLVIWEAKNSWSKLRRVSVWDLLSRRRLGRLTVWSDQAARFTSDGLALVAGVGAAVEVWQLGPWKRLRRLAGPPLAKHGRKLTTAGAHIVVWGYRDKRWRLWHRKTGAVRDFAAPDRMKRVVLSPDGSRLAVVSNRQVALWSATAGRPLRSLSVNQATAVAWSRSGQLLALAQRRPQVVRVVDVATGADRARLPVKHTPNALLFGPGDTELVVGGIGVFGRWAWRSSQQLVVLKKRYRHLSPKGLMFGPGGRRLITFGFSHREITVWDPAAGTILADLYPVQGGHWVAKSGGGAVDATAVGRRTLVTLVPSSRSPSKYGRPRTETVYGWELGWACFLRPGLIPAAVAGRSLTPPKRAHCKIAP